MKTYILRGENANSLIVKAENIEDAKKTVRGTAANFFGSRSVAVFSSGGGTIGKISVEDLSPLTALIADIHRRNVAAGWWTDNDGTDLRDNPMVQAAKMLLIHSELSEAVEYHRKGGKDSHLPERDGLAVELADVFIRWADIVGALGYADTMAEVIAEKRAYNAKRADHSRAARNATGGKKY